MPQRIAVVPQVLQGGSVAELPTTGSGIMGEPKTTHAFLAWKEPYSAGHEYTSEVITSAVPFM